MDEIGYCRIEIPLPAYPAGKTDPKMEPTLRAANEEDKPFLRWLQEVCMRDYAVALWGAWRPSPAEKLVLQYHRIIIDKGEDVGCVATVRDADHIWIDRLYIAPSHQRRGLGGAIPVVTPIGLGCSGPCHWHSAEENCSPGLGSPLLKVLWRHRRTRPIMKSKMIAPWPERYGIPLGHARW